MKKLSFYVLIRIFNKFIGSLLIIYYRLITRYTHTGQIALCCIAKLENEYIRFFVEYYKNLKFDRIILYDNNEIDGERFEEVIGDYIQSGFVELVDFRGKEAPQLKAYQDCYDRFNKKYDWIAFFDCDEFLTFTDSTENIHDYLNQERFESFQVIHFNWMVYGDNEMLDNDGRNVIDRFPKPIMPYGFISKKSRFPVNKHVKSIVRGGLYNIRWCSTAHTPNNSYYSCCNARGNTVDINLFYQDIDYSISFLRHYRTKTIGEWVRYKMRKGDVFLRGEKGKRKTSLDVFFIFNKETEEKNKYADTLIENYNLEK